MYLSLEEDESGEAYMEEHEFGWSGSQPDGSYRRRTRFVLFSQTELPEGHYVIENKYILGGYRVDFSSLLVLKSFFKLHCEAWNSWTHAFGAVFYLGLMIYLIPTLHSKGANALEIGLVVWYICCVMYCLSTSTIFHMFLCRCPKARCVLFKADNTSISVLIGSSSTTLMFFGFSRAPLFWKIFWTSLMLLFMAIGIYAPLFTRMLKQNRFIRSGFYVLWVVLCLVPGIHLYSFMTQEEYISLVVPALGEALTYLAGVGVYVSECPERWFPGRFDYSVSGSIWFHSPFQLFASHPVWHCFVLAGAGIQLIAILNGLEVALAT